jgi:thiamine biosynthesis lipoprotein
MKEIRASFDSVDRTMNNRRDDSLINLLNREAADKPYVVPDRDLFRCITLAREYARTTSGCFDPTLGSLMRAHGFRTATGVQPTSAQIEQARKHTGWQKMELFPEVGAVRFLDDRLEIDLGGMARGYALDVAARTFARPGINAGLLGLGGNICAWGQPPGAESWDIELPGRAICDHTYGRLELSNRTVSSAGDWDWITRGGEPRPSMVIDPATGWRASSDVVAATVIADSGVEADALSTAFLVSGSQGAGSVLNGSRRIEAVLLVRFADGPTLLASGSLKEKLSLSTEFLEGIGNRTRFILPPAQI